MVRALPLNLRALLALSLLFLLLAVTPSSAIYTTVEPGETFTVSEAVPPGTIVMFSFQLDPDYLLAVAAKERDSDSPLQQWQDRSFGALNIAPQDKMHVVEFSFDNSASVVTSVYVNFDIRLVADPTYDFDREQLDPIEQKVRELFDKVHKVRGLQQTLRYQQKNHRATVEDVNERVLWWSLLQVVGFVVMLGAQLYFLKTFLETKRTV